MGHKFAFAWVVGPDLDFRAGLNGDIVLNVVVAVLNTLWSGDCGGGLAVAIGHQWLTTQFDNIRFCIASTGELTIAAKGIGIRGGC